MKKLEYPLSIYPFHIDVMDHVNNSVYVQWMEIGRVLLLEAVGMPLAEITRQGFGPVLVETHIFYKRPLLLADQVTARVWLAQLGGASAHLAFEFWNQQGELAASGAQRGVFIDLASKKPKRLTAAQRQQFSAYLIAPDE